MLYEIVLFWGADFINNMHSPFLWLYAAKMSEKDANLVPADCCLLAELPDHLLIEVFIRVPMSNWGQISCVRKHWANLFREECFWFAALLRSFPFAGQSKRWPGPIPRGLSKRSITAATQLSLSLYIYLSTYSKHIDLFTAKKKKLKVVS